MKKPLFLLLAAMTSLSSFADNRFEYTYEGKVLNYEVTDEDNATCKLLYCNSDNSGKVIIPDYAINNGKKYHVTYINYSAFEECKGVTSISIPNSVTRIGVSAFSGCTGLTSITIPNSVTRIGKSAFSGCTGLTSITIPNSATEIEGYAFSDCI